MKHLIDILDLGHKREVSLAAGPSSDGPTKRLDMYIEPSIGKTTYRIMKGDDVIAEGEMTLQTAVDIYNDEAPF